MVKVYRVETKIRRIGPFIGTNYYNTFGHRFMTDHDAKFDYTFKMECKDARHGVSSEKEMKRLLKPCKVWSEDGTLKDKAKINNFVVRTYVSDKLHEFTDGQVMFDRSRARIENEWSILDFIKEE